MKAKCEIALWWSELVMNKGNAAKNENETPENVDFIIFHTIHFDRRFVHLPLRSIRNEVSVVVKMNYIPQEWPRLNALELMWRLIISCTCCSFICNEMKNYCAKKSFIVYWNLRWLITFCVLFGLMVAHENHEKIINLSVIHVNSDCWLSAARTFLK